MATVDRSSAALLAAHPASALGGDVSRKLKGNAAQWHTSTDEGLQPEEKVDSFRALSFWFQDVNLTETIKHYNAK